jgi:hypothetical protein
MRLTFLGPPGQPVVANQRPTLGRSDWEREYARLSEPIEQPIKARLTQIIAGLGFQASVFKIGTWIIRHTHKEMLEDLLNEMLSGVGPLSVPLYLLALILGLFALSTLVGGAVAGAWCINWRLQGMAVGLWFLGGVALDMALFVPWSMFSQVGLPPMLLASLGAVSLIVVTLTTLGALLGHLLIRPIRVPLDRAR